MKKKNGFIAISLIYSFFLCFIMIMMYLLANYTHSRLILNQVNKPLVLRANSTLSSIIKSSSSDFLSTATDTSYDPTTEEITEGISYYYKGNPTNNYVSFGIDSSNNPLIWRIVRINGNGSVRIILNTAASSIKESFNYRFDDERYVGYTYDNKDVLGNNYSCTKNSPCISQYDSTTNDFSNNIVGDNSNIKEKLENWYKANLATLDEKIEENIYCNDTSISSESDSTIHFSATDRTFYSFDCNDTEKNYGGLYILKIGLMTYDEYRLSINGTQTYMSSIGSSYFMTPHSYENNKANIAGKSSDSGEKEYTTDESAYYYPVINLKSGIKVISGDGTVDNPYIVEN